MIRLVILTLFVTVLAIYAWRDWYKSLCGLILMMAVIEHPDMPKSIFGVQGLNPWNLCFVSIALAWLASRSGEQRTWDMPRYMNFLFLVYLGVVLVGFYRMVTDLSGMAVYDTGTLYSEHLVNSVKWVIPGLLLYDGCRSRERFVIALYSLLGLYFLLGLQVIKWMPASAVISGADLSARSLKILVNEVGYHRVNLSMMLGGASWAILATLPLAERTRSRFLILCGFLIIAYAQALTAGRMGYVTWAVVGTILCMLRWRRYLLLAPIIVLLIVILLPATVERMYQGFTPESRDSNPFLAKSFSLEPEEGPDPYTVTAGRNIAWPYIVDKIQAAPYFGYGREGMYRTGLAGFLWREYRESFPHPHNAYLELLLDNGWVGFVLVIPFYLVILSHAMSLFRDSRDPIFVVIGGVTSALVLALLIASVGSQTFYPREGSVGMWCAIGLMLRVHVERSRIPVKQSQIIKITDRKLSAVPCIWGNTAIESAPG